MPVYWGLTEEKLRWIITRAKNETSRMGNLIITLTEKQFVNTTHRGKSFENSFNKAMYTFHHQAKTVLEIIL